MTRLVLRATVPCALCGYHRPYVRFASVRVNTMTIRETGTTLAWGPGPCSECGWCDRESSLRMPPFRLDAADTAKVEAIRARRKARSS